MRNAGDRIDRYVIESLLGEGGMGQVYLARDTQLGRKVALKLLRTDDGVGTEGAARILREARAAAALEHPNAVAIYDVRESDGVTFLAMEYVEGRSLRAAMDDHRVPLAQRVRWLADVARALGAAHRVGLVHRDVKPENVMIKADGVVKVLDFGIARLTTGIDPHAATAVESLSSSTLSGRGLLVGTPLYMAPEQMRGDAIDGRADQFAWGVTAYEVLTGELPWTKSREAVHLIAEVVSSAPVSTLSGRAPPDVAAIVDRTLAKDPAARFPSMEDVVSALEGTARPEARALSSPESVARVAPPKRSRAPLLVGLVAAAAAFVAGGFALTRRETPSASTSSSTASASAASAPVKVTELPLPTSASAEALLHYRKGLQDFHDGSIARAHGEMAQALALNPALAAAHLREAVWPGSPRGRSRAAFLAAQPLRASLDERDRDLLRAFEPYLATDAADATASEQRLVALATRHPRDAEIALLAGWMAALAGHLAESRGSLARALELDPSFAAVEFERAGVLASDDDARAALQHCVELSPTAASCLRALAFREAARGDCSAYESVAGRSLAVDPDGEVAARMMLGALMSRGRPSAAMDPLISRLGAVQGGDDAEARGAVAAHFGDFARALTLLRAAVDSSTKLHRDTPRMFASVLLFHVAEEIGDAETPVPVARAYLGERATWDPDAPELDGLALGWLGRSHAPEAERAAARTQLWDALGKKLAPDDHCGRFVVDAAAVKTADEARHALATLGDAKVSVQDEPVRAAAVGRALLLGGRLAEARAPLTSAAHNCAVLGQWAPAVVARVWARADLAELAAQQGDVSAACEGFRAVIAQWGDAKPRSLTAERARARMLQLRCPKG